MPPDVAFLADRRLTVYSSHGCPDCTRLERWLRGAGVAYDEVLIDEVPGAADELERATGKQGVPYLLVDGARWVRGYHLEERGRFSEARLLDELRAALR